MTPQSVSSPRRLPFYFPNPLYPGASLADGGFGVMARLWRVVVFPAGAPSVPEPAGTSRDRLGAAHGLLTGRPTIQPVTHTSYNVVM